MGSFKKTGGMHLLPPYGNSNALYRGRLEAMAQVKPFIESSNAEYVLLSDADVVANIDYRPIIDFHEKTVQTLLLYTAEEHSQQSRQ